MLFFPVNWLDAILSLLHPLDGSRTLSAIGSAIGRPYLALSCIHTKVAALNPPFLNRLGGSTARWWCYVIQKTVPGRVRVKFAQNGGHEKPRSHEKETKKARTLFF